MRDKIVGRREAYEREYRRTSQIIESRFDDDVRKVFRHLRDELPAGLLQLDRDIADLVEGYLQSHDVGFVRSEADGRILFDVENSVPAAVGEAVNDERRFATGDARGLGQAQPLNLSIPSSSGRCTTPASGTAVRSS